MCILVRGFYSVFSMWCLCSFVVWHRGGVGVVCMVCVVFVCHTRIGSHGVCVVVVVSVYYVLCGVYDQHVCGVYMECVVWYRCIGCVHVFVVCVLCKKQ